MPLIITKKIQSKLFIKIIKITTTFSTYFVHALLSHPCNIIANAGRNTHLFSDTFHMENTYIIEN